MIVGFTGTREGCTDLQLAWLYTLLENDNVTEVHHGACVGADYQVHMAALAACRHVHVWPPTNPRYVAGYCLSHEVPSPAVVTVHPAMPYLHRDREIVRAAQYLIALPKQDEQPDRAYWGGTWYTVNFAERVNKQVVVCYPNGRIETREPLRETQ